MNLHESPKEFQDLIEAAAQYLNMRPVFIEKDYWVTYVLMNLSNSEQRDKVVFKGGTSLSKAYASIDRFSEDIDLAILSPDDYSAAKMKALLKQVEKDCTTGLTLIPGHSSEVKFGRNRTTAYKYPRILNYTNFGIVKEYILVEINCFTNPVPFKERKIQTYIAQFLNEQKDMQSISEFGLESFSVNVLSTERTYFEKVLSVSRLSYNGGDALKEKIRHFYDIHKLQNLPELKNKMLTPEYFELLNAAREDDENNLTMAGDWINNPISVSPLFSDLENTWAGIVPVYQKDLPELVWSATIPSPEEVLETLKALKQFIIKFDEKFPPKFIVNNKKE